MRLLYFILVLFVGLSSCRKDYKPPLVDQPDPVCEDCFNIEFYFVNEGDTVNDLKIVHIETAAYSDTLDQSRIHYTLYSDSAYAAQFLPEHPPENYLKEDTTFHSSYGPATLGSAKNMQVTISYRDSLGAQYRTQRFILSDTTNVVIETPEEAIEIFHWPSDTNRYTKVFDIWN